MSPTDRVGDADERTVAGVAVVVGLTLALAGLWFPARVSDGFSVPSLGRRTTRLLTTLLFGSLALDGLRPADDPATALRTRGAGLFGLVVAGGAVALVLMDDGVRPGIGLWLPVAGSVLVTAGGVVRVRRARRRSAEPDGRA